MTNGTYYIGLCAAYITIVTPNIGICCAAYVTIVTPNIANGTYYIGIATS